jgi:serine/threonine-protein kinase
MPEPVTPGGHDALLGRLLGGKIEILDHLGQGGMGTVYRARHRLLDKIVAVKVLREADPKTHAEHALRFGIEAQAASRLEHPNSVRVLDFGREPDELLYLVMEHLEGRSLSAAIRSEGRIDPARVVRWTQEVLAALEEAHEAGVLHRDIKPSNIMLVLRRGDDGSRQESAKLCDFGLAQWFGPLADPTLTSDDSLIGTPAYIAPEQLGGGPLDGRVDLYALGVVMYSALSGRSPYKFVPGVSLQKQLAQNFSTGPEALRAELPEIDPSLEAIVVRAMEIDRERRFRSASEMRRALRELANLQSETTPPSPPLKKRAPSEWTSVVGAPTKTVFETRPRRIWIPLLLALVGSAVVGLSLVQRHEPAALVLPTVPPAPPSVPPAPADPAAVLPAEVEIEVRGVPESTLIKSPTGLLGVGPGRVRVPRGELPVVLTFTAPGYLQRSEPVVPSEDLSLEVHLKKRPSPPTRDALENPFR